MQAKANQLPHVLVNMAMTADGKIATANRAVSRFGSRRDTDGLYDLRATADAVMCGARTVAAGEVRLDPGPIRYRRRRRRAGLAESHLRVLVSGSGRVSPAAAIFKHRFSPILILATEKAGPRRLRNLARLADEVRICGREEIDFAAALRWLRRKWNVRRLLVEGGGELNGALFGAGLVDELHLTICPLLFGGRRAPTIAEGAGPASLAGLRALELVSKRLVGGELFLVFRRR